MSDMVVQKNIAALVTPRLASAFSPLTAGGAGNAVAVNGVAFQRSSLRMPRSAALVLAFSAVLSATKTLSLATVKLQDSADGSTWADYLTFTDPAVVATGAGTVQGQVAFNCSFLGARDYIRAVFTPTLSNTATDTATVLAMFAFGGFDRLPAPA